MPDFNRYSNYKPETSFSGVVFGARAPVLEVELNEVQQILDTKLDRVASFFGNLVIPDSGGGFTFNEETKELSITRCTVISGSLTAYIPQASITLDSRLCHAELILKERVITSEDPIRRYGVQNNEDFAENTMIDSRVRVETSRRKVIEVKLIKHDGVNIDEGDMTNVTASVLIPLGHMQSDGTFVRTVESSSLGDITNKLNQQQAITTHYENSVLYLSITNPGFGSASSGGGSMGSPVNPVVIPIASRTVAGLVKIGDGINIASDGTISSSIEAVSDEVADTAAAKVISQMDDIDDSEIDAMFNV